MDGFNKFLLVERHGVIIISNLELSLETSNTSTSSLGKGVSELLQKLFVRKVHWRIISNIGSCMSLSSFCLRLSCDWISVSSFVSDRWLSILV